MDEIKIDAIYSTLQLMNKNAIIEFLIKMENLSLDLIKDKTIILKYIDMIVNYTKICKQMNIDEELSKQLHSLKIKLIQYLNKRADKEQGL